MKTTLNGLLFILFFVPAFMLAQNSVTGTVTEQSTSLPLPGVNIIIQGTSSGTATDFDGNYLINVNSGDVLLFSYVGYVTQEIPYNGQSSIDVQLLEDAAQLDEVVVIGYGTTTKKDATGSVDVVTAKDFNQAVISPDQMLQGKAAGVRITNTGGQPDAGPNIRIRAGASLSAKNSPLIVVDGIPVDNSGPAGTENPFLLINPNDIESFSILKDASATAIYGSRASNGVLIITTKKGTSGDVKFNFSARTSISDIRSDDQINVMDGNTFVRFAQEYFPDDLGLLGVPVGSVDTDEEVSQIISTPLGDRAIYNTDWQDAVYRTAITNDYNFSARANLLGKIPFRASVGYNNTEGVVKKNDLERITASFRITPKFLDDHLKVDVNAKGALLDKNGGFLPDGAVRMDPTKPIYDRNSLFGEDNPLGGKDPGYYQLTLPPDDALNPNSIRGAWNPVAVLQQQDRPEKIKSLLANAELDYKFHALPELRAVTNLGLEATRSKIEERYSENAIATYRQVGAADDPGTYIFNPGVNYRERQHRTNVTWESFLIYKKELEGYLNSFDVQAGYSYQNFKNDGNKDEFWYNEATGEREPNINPNNTNNRYYNELNLQSFFGRSNINLGDRYLVTLSLRADGSSYFTEDNRWGYFPAAALAWKVKEESFLKDVDLINDLKVRLSWGETGQQEISGSVGFYPSIPVFEVGSQESQFIEGVTLYNAKEFNPDLTWEKTTTYNLGIDFDFFNNSFLTGSFDIFKRETTDLLVLTNVPPGQALSDRLIQNVGSTDSEGFELNLNLSPVQNETVNISLNGNISYNITEITDLDGAQQIFAGGGLPIGTGNFLKRHALGEQAGSAWVFKQVYNEDGKPDNGAFVDLNGDGSITDDDRYYRAIQPNWTFGFGLNMNVKNWDFSASFRGQLDGEIYNARRLTSGVIDNVVAQDGLSLNNTLDFYTRTADIEITDVVDPIQYSDYFLENASFLRCENIVIGHSLNELFKDVRFKVYFAVNNPFIVTNYSGQDPENFGGIDNDFYPRPTVYNLGVNLDF